MLTGSFSRTRLLRPTSSNLGRRLSCSRFSVSAVTYKDTDTLAGTVAFHNIYVLLHSRKPPSEHPSKVPSKLQRALQLQAIQWRGLVNFSYLPEQAVHPAQSATDVPEWEDEHGEAYGVTAFSRYRGRLDLPMRVSTENLDEVAATLQAHASQTGPNGLSSHLTGAEREVHIYICTHGQRDCRCGETGGAVYEALRKEVAKRNLSETVKVGSVGHVGGHKYAANILVFPHGEWLGNIKEDNVPEVLDAILSRQGERFSPEFSLPLLPHFWRGRMGLDKEEQIALRPRDTAPVSDIEPHPSRSSISLD